MIVVVADTSPLNYLIQIHGDHVLPARVDVATRPWAYAIAVLLDAVAITSFA